ncbi:cytochrome P450 [Natrialba asiatica]|uniref:Unspecific monooxygenase n=1 Tax=Natrialba asiatica (strain ATCC 700177 / DSM 12278 / JCM 9576 / FERM P-10747 / NBRC 102637 / 172P1) TaxID=29540 RepID=M0AWV0_NATA1|nr:cytochrome P450 [Natrialba asiatica]ELZ02448.1 Unspecific monooxygenase [Natrialba asiatica DSM 12278]
MSSEPSAVTDDHPPGPDGLPLVGNQLAFLRHPYEFMTETAREYGDIAYWEDPTGPVYQLNHPDYIEQVLVQNNQHYVKGARFQNVLGPATGNGILNSEGAVWRRNRHLIQPAFRPDRIEEYASMMTEFTEEKRETWNEGETRPFHEDMMEVTLKIVARALFGVDIDDDVETVGSALDEFMLATESLSHMMLPPRVPTPSRRRIQRARESLDAVVYRMIEERRANPTDRDVISKLLEVTDEDGTKLSDEQIRDEVVTLLLAGHETTALSLTFTAYLLATNPAAEERLVDELDDVLGGETPTMADLDDLTYTEQVVEESMRLYPPVPGIVREPAKPDIIGGYEIEPGATVRMHQWVVHRDPRWYDDPLAFRPARWTDDLKQSLPKLAYFPFAAGPRRCIGDRFAMLEARLLLATIYQDYHLELVPGTELDLMATITARPKDEIPMTVRER